jgi:predicted transcriptional regulator
MVEPSDFEIVLGCVNSKPGLTGREIYWTLRKQGNERFTAKTVNQVLYRLLSASMVLRDGSGDKPKWYPLEESRVDFEQSIAKRPLVQTKSIVRNYLIAATEVKVMLDNGMSPNDPYITPDWVGSHVIASVNVRHPFWTLRLDGQGDEALFCMMTAIDAYVQWKIAQLHQPPDATELQMMRDYALRFCTLIESELTTCD